MHALVLQRHARNYRALVAATVAEVEIKLPLTAEQRAQLIELAVGQTTAPTVTMQSYMQYSVVLYKLSKLDDEAFQPIFPDDAELRLFRSLMQQAEGWGRQIEQLENGGEGRGLLEMLF